MQFSIQLQRSTVTTLSLHLRSVSASAPSPAKPRVIPFSRFEKTETGLFGGANKRLFGCFPRQTARERLRDQIEIFIFASRDDWWLPAGQDLWPCKYLYIDIFIFYLISVSHWHFYFRPFLRLGFKFVSVLAVYAPPLRVLYTHVWGMGGMLLFEYYVCYIDMCWLHLF